MLLNLCEYAIPCSFLHLTYAQQLSTALHEATLITPLNTDTSVYGYKAVERSSTTDNCIDKKLTTVMRHRDAMLN